jgi:hypothetical protein
MTGPRRPVSRAERLRGPLARSRERLLRMSSAPFGVLALLLIVGGALDLPAIAKAPPRDRLAASPSLADVRAAVRAAHPGDRVIIPAGTARWASQLVVTKSISLVGAGIGSTTIIGGFSGTLFQSDDCLISYDLTAASVRTFRISGISFNGNAMCAPLFIVNASPRGEPIRIRIDHCDFDNLRGDGTTSWITSWGTVYGVVDNCVFHDAMAKEGVSTISPYGGNEVSWRTTKFEFGDADNLYFEDNVFYWKDQVFQGGAGGRVAIRHNTFKYIGPATGGVHQFIDVHGNYKGENYSAFGLEVYENDIEMNGGSIQFVDMRGGKGLFYDNRVHDCGPYLVFQLREEDLPWRGHDANNPPAVSPLNGQPQHISDTYIWNISRNGIKYLDEQRLAYVQGTIDYADPRQIDYRAAYAPNEVVPREDVHFWREKVPFTGATGMGSGRLAERPPSCTLEGAAYWAADEAKLYRWHRGAWQLFYAPYPYPHPLRAQLAEPAR